MPVHSETIAQAHSEIREWMNGAIREQRILEARNLGVSIGAIDAARAVERLFTDDDLELRGHARKLQALQMFRTGMIELERLIEVLNGV